MAGGGQAGSRWWVYKGSGRGQTPRGAAERARTSSVPGLRRIKLRGDDVLCSTRGLKGPRAVRVKLCQAAASGVGAAWSKSGALSPGSRGAQAHPRALLE